MAFSQQAAGRDIALLFYCTNFNDPSYKALPETKLEVEELEKILENDYSFVVETVEMHSRESILNKIDSIKNNIRPTDRLLVYFSTHGYYNMRQEKGFLVPKNIKNNDRSGIYLISYSDIGDNLIEMNCNQVLVLLDACHSGSFGKRYKDGGPTDFPGQSCEEKINKAKKVKSRIFIAAAAKGQRIPSKSPFAKAIMKKLVENKEYFGYLSLVDKVKQEISGFTDSCYGSFGDIEMGEFIFVKKGYCNGTNDKDLDGIPDETDQCRDQHGTKKAKGCPDFDDDGVPDFLDRCIDAIGWAGSGGCPDKDRDSVPDITDKCPEKKGKTNWEGCPDSDQDNLPDHRDKCPEKKGPVYKDGCPLPDSDADGVPDSLDICMHKKGLINNYGCPQTEKIPKPTLELSHFRNNSLVQISDFYGRYFLRFDSSFYYISRSNDDDDDGVYHSYFKKSLIAHGYHPDYKINLSPETTKGYKVKDLISIRKGLDPYQPDEPYYLIQPSVFPRGNHSVAISYGKKGVLESALQVITIKRKVQFPVYFVFGCADLGQKTVYLDSVIDIHNFDPPLPVTSSYSDSLIQHSDMADFDQDSLYSVSNWDIRDVKRRHYVNSLFFTVGLDLPFRTSLEFSLYQNYKQSIQRLDSVFSAEKTERLLWAPIFSVSGNVCIFRLGKTYKWLDVSLSATWTRVKSLTEVYESQDFSKSFPVKDLLFSGVEVSSRVFVSSLQIDPLFRFIWNGDSFLSIQTGLKIRLLR